MFQRIAAAVALSVVVAVPAFAQTGGPSGRVASPDARRDAEGKYLFKYGPAQEALQRAFPRADVLPVWGDTKQGQWTANIKCAVKHLAEVDAPVQGGGGQRADTKKLYDYVVSTNHPKNGNVNQWYKQNFPELENPQARPRQQQLCGAPKY